MHDLAKGQFYLKEICVKCSYIILYNKFLAQGLRAGVSWGQCQFQKLMENKSPGEDVELEDLRYRWMLYKSKIKETGDLEALTKHKVRRKKLFSLYAFLLFC